MPRRTALLVGLALGLCAIRPALAADAQGQFAVKGVGQARCYEFNDAVAKRSPQMGAMLSWVAGYLTAANRYEAQTYDLVSWQDELYILANMRSYCARNPETPLILMARQMVRSMGPGRVAAASPLVAVTVGGQQVRLYGAVVERAKSRLSALGLYRGPMNANPDGPFIAAIAGFQRSNRLAPTGVPDQATLFRLFAR